jgi:hyperosmotically inducible periplasmic protein
MLRGLFKLLLIVIVLVAAGAFLLGWWGTGRFYNADEPREVVGTSGVDREKAREAGAKAGEKAADVVDRTAQAAEVAKDKTVAAAAEARETLAEGSLTAKIKAKMALDDHVKALNLDVDTVGTVVTVSGYAHSQTEKDRALQLAKETAGVTQVVDKITVR